MTEERTWHELGQQQVDNPMEIDRIPLFDPRSGEHFWIMALAYRVDPKLFADGTHTPILDRENLASVSGPGCYYCEQPYSPQIAARRCRGHG